MAACKEGKNDFKILNKAGCGLGNCVKTFDVQLVFEATTVVQLLGYNTVCKNS